MLTKCSTDLLLVTISSCYSEQAQALEGLGAGGVHCNWCSRLLVCLHPEPQLEGPHEQDDERSGGSAESRAESSRPAAEVSVTSYILTLRAA